MRIDDLVFIQFAVKCLSFSETIGFKKGVSEAKRIDAAFRLFCIEQGRLDVIQTAGYMRGLEGSIKDLVPELWGVIEPIEAGYVQLNSVGEAYARVMAKAKEPDLILKRKEIPDAIKRQLQAERQQKTEKQHVGIRIDETLL